MKSICFIGNSHIGAWKHAWANVGPDVLKEFSATFFAAPRLAARMEDLRFENGKFIPGGDELRSFFELSSGGKSEIVCADYDAFVLVGLDAFLALLKLSNRYGTAAHAEHASVERLVSEDFLRTVICDQAESFRAILGAIRSVSRAPVFLAPSPFPSEALLETSDYERHRDGAETGYLAAVQKSYKSALETLTSRHRAEVLWQDVSTMRHPGFTRAKFFEGAVRLAGDAEHRKTNAFHANDAFGTLMLDELFSRLKKLSSAHHRAFSKNEFPVCVIGSSHVAALRGGWAQKPPPVRDDVSMTFFATRAGKVSDHELADGVLIAPDDVQRSDYVMTSGGKDRIVCGDYKAFILVGLGISFAFKLSQFREFATHQGLPWAPGGQLISESCACSLTESLLESSKAVTLLDQIKSVSDAPVLICPQPCRSESYLQAQRGDPFWEGAPAYLPVLYEQFQIATNRLIARHGGLVIWQDPSTMRFPGLTKDEFRIGAKGLGEGDRPADDTQHMNANFGALQLVDVFRELDQLVPSKALAEAS